MSAPVYRSVMRIVFLGAGEFGLPTLAQLHRRHEVALVVTQPDRPAGRHRKPTATPIGQWAADLGLPLIKPDHCNEEPVLETVRAAKPDAIVVIAFGQYIKKAMANLPPLGSVNLHASLLPKYRGAGPIHWAILNGETQTGNTIMRIAPKMDAGAMLGQQSTPIEPTETAGQLHDRLAAMGPDLMAEVLDRLARGEAEEIEQDESRATEAPKLSRADGWVDFNADADAVRRRINGLSPWPGVTAWWSEGVGDPAHALKLNRAAPAEGQGQPGQLLGDGEIACGGGAVRLLEVQPPGKRAMNWADYEHGHAIPHEARLVGNK